MTDGVCDVSRDSYIMSSVAHFASKKNLFLHKIGVKNSENIIVAEVLTAPNLANFAPRVRHG